MAVVTLHLFSAAALSVVRTDGQPFSSGVNPAQNPYTNGNAYSWNTPSDLAITLPTSTVSLTYQDSNTALDGVDPSAAQVSDQLLADPITVGGTTYTPNGSEFRWQGTTFVSNHSEVTLYGADGTEYRMVSVTVTAGWNTPSVVGVFFEGPQPPAGATLYYRQGQSTFQQDGTQTAVPCFLAGTLIDTPDGPRAVQDLRVGDLVLTLDNGPQPVRWIGRSQVDGTGDLAPVCIRAGTFGNTRDLHVSPNHRVLVRSSQAELLFGTSEVLVAAKFLIDGETVTTAPRPVADYLHLMLDNHELVASDGVLSETLFAGPVALQALPEAARAELRAIFPDIDTAGHRLARADLTRQEARMLVAAPAVAHGFSDNTAHHA